MAVTNVSSDRACTPDYSFLRSDQNCEDPAVEELNEAKGHVAKIDACTFLSFTFRRNKLRWSERAFNDFNHHVKKLTGRSWGISMEYRLNKLAQYVRGWRGYFGISQYYRPIPELDEWLRRRVRMCYWKQRRLCGTKVGNLLKLGVGLRRRSSPVSAAKATGIWHARRRRNRECRTHGSRHKA
jgi:RNA-directed DNA polymerase